MQIFYYSPNGQLVSKQFNNSVILIGRHHNNTLALPDETVSSRHASITKIDGHYILTDLGSTNGSLVNGSIITKKILQHADFVQFGEFECWFYLEGHPGIPSISGKSAYPKGMTKFFRALSGDKRQVLSSHPNHDFKSTQEILKSLQKSVCLLTSNVIAKSYLIPDQEAYKMLKSSSGPDTVQISDSAQLSLTLSKGGRKPIKKFCSPNSVFEELKFNKPEVEKLIFKSDRLILTFFRKMAGTRGVLILYIEHFKPTDFPMSLAKKLKIIFNEAGDWLINRETKAKQALNKVSRPASFPNSHPNLVDFPGLFGK